MGINIKESIKKLQLELNYEIEELISEGKEISSLKVIKISRKLDALIVKDLKNKLKIS